MDRPRLSILCVSKGEPNVLHLVRQLFDQALELDAEMVLIADGSEAYHAFETLIPEKASLVRLQSAGFLESILDDALAFCHGSYVFRVDDDESFSRDLFQWLRTGEYTSEPIWKFPRMHLWPDERSLIVTPHLWPDHQTRLARRELSGGRRTLHAPSPFGSGALAPVAFRHHKFVVKDRQQREQTAKCWHTGPMKAFSLPEDVYDKVLIMDTGSGSIPWDPVWTQNVEMTPRAYT